MRPHPLLAFATTFSTASLAALGHAGAAGATTAVRPVGAHRSIPTTESIHINERPDLSILIDGGLATIHTARRAGGHRAARGRTRVVAKILHRVRPLGGVWAALRNCESAGNYAEDTGNGYYGAYQFSLSTWRGLGRTGLPSAAPPALQDAMAERLQALSGWRPWPLCSATLGLA